jgi:hypothetical protein
MDSSYRTATFQLLRRSALAWYFLLLTPLACLAQSWTNIGNIGTGRALHSATLLSSGKVLVAGGYDGSAALDTAQLYDPSNNAWTSTSNKMAVSRYGHAAGHSCVAVIGPNGERSLTVETGKDDRVDNMRVFSIAALDLLEKALA